MECPPQPISISVTTQTLHMERDTEKEERSNRKQRKADWVFAYSRRNLFLCPLTPGANIRRPWVNPGIRVSLIHCIDQESPNLTVTYMTKLSPW